MPSQSFRLVSLQTTDPPSGSESSDWFRYVITQSGNRIEGCRQGDLEEVRLEVQELVDRLNDRRMGKRNVPQSKPGPKKPT